MLFDEQRLTRALAELGIRDVSSDDAGRPVSRAFLLAALLALIESGLVTDRGRDDPGLGDGRGWVLDLLADHDAAAAHRTRAVLLRDRLNRTADEVRAVASDAPAGGLNLAGVVGPAVLAAANTATLLHVTPEPAVVVTAVTTAAANLRMAAAALDELRAALRRDGIDV